jgi:hypothetical protein
MSEKIVLHISGVRDHISNNPFINDTKSNKEFCRQLPHFLIHYGISLLYCIIISCNFSSIYTHFTYFSKIICPFVCSIVVSFSIMFFQLICFTAGYECTVSWWIRKLSCIEEVPRLFSSIQLKIKFKNLNWLQLNLN